MEQARIEHAPNGSLLTYITIAVALANEDQTAPKELVWSSLNDS